MKRQLIAILMFTALCGGTNLWPRYVFGSDTPADRGRPERIAVDGTGSAAVAQPAQDGFVSLFDGRTFRGWYAADRSWWSIQDGAITGTITEEKPCRKNQYIFYEPHKPGDEDLPLYDSRGVMSNFELKLTHRILSPHKVNGGFQYRSEHYNDGDCKGYQIDNNTKTPWLARMYDEFGRHTLAWRGERARFDESGGRHVTKIETVPAKAHFEIEKWHTYHLVCRGTHMTLSIDGELVAEVFDEQPSAADLSGLFAPQLHSGPPMVVQFKDILFKPLPPTMPVPNPAAGKPAVTDKTLVSWVTLADRSVRAGSVLTIQSGSEFDGIVFAEREADKWMAGSDNFKRTQREQDKNPKESADSRTTLQIAVVYQGSRISIYRNAELYASYEAGNIDLLGRTNNIAVFGLRHVDGDGGIAGSIEDARIYDRALSVDEIRALKPDIASGTDPYAWWDFEGDKVVDRAGRFKHNVMGGGAKLEDGRLVLVKDAALVAATRKEDARITGRNVVPVFAGPYVPETPAWPENPPNDWLTFHLAHPGPGVAMPGDPNPAFFWKGRYHLHYIYRNHTGFVFAHVSSEDMVHWKWHPTVLAPPATGHGMFSGTGFITKDGRAAMVYHGQGSGRNWIAYALDDNMDKWSKPEVMLPNDSDGRPFTSVSYFDPDIWLNNGVYYGLNGQSSTKPALLMKSSDLKEWAHLGELLHPDFDEERLGVKRDEDISCANMFKLGGRWVLTCISHRLGCRYFIGDFKDEQYLPEFHAMMSWGGNNFFAPESLLTEDGRRVMWAWIKGGAKPTGVQSLPRELELPQDGVLRIKPLRELQSLRYDERAVKSTKIEAGRELKLDLLKGDAVELEVGFAAPLPTEFGLRMLADDKGGKQMSITAGAGMKKLMIGNVHPEFSLGRDEDLVLRIFIDRNLVEVFANDRQAAVYPHSCFSKDPGVTLFTKDSELVVKGVRVWRMKSIYMQNE